MSSVEKIQIGQINTPTKKKRKAKKEQPMKKKPSKKPALSRPGLK